MANEAGVSIDERLSIITEGCLMFGVDRRLGSLGIRYFILLLLPSCIVSLALALRKASGPFWQGNLFEAEYSYLMNSLAVSQGLRVWHADHPGSTLQLLGGLLLHGINLVAGKGSLVSDVLMRPELYIHSLYSFFIFSIFISIFIAGLLSWRWSNNFLSAIFFQLSFLLCYSIVSYSLPRMKPESMILVLDILLSITIIYNYYLRRINIDDEPFFYYGIIIGAGVALKITFAPLAMLPLLIMNGIRRKVWFIIISLSVFFAITANPLMNFKGFMGFLTGHLVARKGYNRPIVEGSDGFEAMGQGMDRLFHFLLGREQILLALLVCFLVAGVVILWTGKKREPSASDLFFKRLWFGLLLVMACQFLLVANGPGAKSHYIVPATGLIGLIAYVAWVWPVLALKYYKKTLLLFQFAYLVLFLTGFLWAGQQLPAQIRGLKKESAAWLEAYQYRKENNLLDIPTIYYYRASNLQYALAFGNELSGKHFSNNLASIYPDCFSFHIWSRVLYGSFGNEVLQLNEVVRRSGAVLIQGENAYPPVIAGLKKEDYPASPHKHYRMSGAVIPADSGQALSAKVIFNGSREWLVMVESFADKVSLLKE